MKKLLIIIFIVTTCYKINAQDYSTWSSFDTLNIARNTHAAILLSNGNILAAGGVGKYGEFLSSCEIYDLDEKKWRNTSSMNYPRYHLNLIKLLDNRILAVSGESIKSCEIFDPITEMWSVTDSLFIKRSSYDINSILLNDGRVLITGGFFIDNDLKTRGFLNICEIFDPVTNKWTLTDTLKSKRAGHTMTKLKDGRILVTGGFNEESLFINKCEIFDPGTNKWTLVDSLNIARNDHSAILLLNGNVLIAGGKDGVNPTDPWLSSCELYDPEKNEWTVVEPLFVARTNAKTFFISDSLIMFVGGGHNAHLWEIYNINKFKPVYIDSYPVEKLYSQIITLDKNILISIGGFEVDTSDEIPIAFASNKCEIYRYGVTSINGENLILQNLILNQNYPNPFNPFTTIKYALPQNSHVILEVYNTLGEKVVTLVDNVISAGFHEAVFNGSNLASGIYIYRITANSPETGEQFVKSAQMLMLK